jgi:hypothetical protein
VNRKQIYVFALYLITEIYILTMPLPSVAYIAFPPSPSAAHELSTKESKLRSALLDDGPRNHIASWASIFFFLLFLAATFYRKEKKL